MKYLLIITIAIGTWLSVASIIQFSILLSGKYIYEHSSIIAIIELVIACLFTLWFILILPLLVMRRLRKGGDAN